MLQKQGRIVEYTEFMYLHISTFHIVHIWIYDTVCLVAHSGIMIIIIKLGGNILFSVAACAYFFIQCGCMLLVLVNNLSVSEAFCCSPLCWLRVTGNTGKVLVGSAARSMVTLPRKAGSSLQMHELHPTFTQEKTHPRPELHVEDMHL